MNTLTNQDYQKSVVAFVAGLLIGGLLVWVFSAEEAAPVAKSATDMSAAAVAAADATTTAAAPVIGAGKVAVAGDVTAGTSVAVTVTEYPATDGWVAIRDYTDGALGNVLGASRYSQSDGRYPAKVDLFRATEAGKSYAVVFYTQATDFETTFEMVEGVMTPFTVN
ncbi:hypothetical protein A3C89_03665 [Candidatus Kaiserbacteria bacterium RIFCSPHIGHO2_02_FULL_50_50]|uniref:Uncharacterized protein n=1 Tax=Candidatus Kaiserbacteria bacterium RIFCSPHIGHO2_02_FULL_50_50 TaxID=1798492 RepID=A0A1F6DC10_9BACT|nr:MAG: hypothetical protein A3C89_03665 [Candidatus Kaiserbacteria bacterium RIFCSPHIGHO2_02_FULL_50_50]OGG88558.1 MAG: hypothetical protein A3G62_03560 [Candidatus Kaiserbacteria bacterium RIFCSPLOWO2_12_FULL_50_10]